MTLSHSPNIVRDGLVLYLDAANPKSYPGTGTVWSDLSVNNYNGTLFNGVGYSSDSQGVLTFDGSNDYVSVPHQSNLNPNLAMTLSGWVKLSNFTNTITIFGKGTTSSGSGGFDFRIDTSSTLNLVKYYIIDQTITIPTLSINTWYNISAVQSTNKVDYYVNGESVGSFSNSSSYQTNTTSLKVGLNRDTRYLPGSIGCILFYKKIFTAQEIKQNFNALRGRYGI